MLFRVRIRMESPLIMTKAVIGNSFLSREDPIIPGHTVRGAILASMVEHGLISKEDAIFRSTEATFYPAIPEGHDIKPPLARNVYRGGRKVKVYMKPEKIKEFLASDEAGKLRLMGDVGNFRELKSVRLKAMSRVHVEIDWERRKARLDPEGGRLFSYVSWLPIKENGEKADFLSLIWAEGVVEGALRRVQELPVFIGRGRSRGFGFGIASFEEADIDLGRFVEESMLEGGCLAVFSVGWVTSFSPQGSVPLPDLKLCSRVYGEREILRRVDLPGQERYHIALNASRPGTLMAVVAPSDPDALLRGQSQLSPVGLNLMWPVTAMTEVSSLLGGGSSV